MFGFEAFDVALRVPLAVPVVVGAKLTVNVVLCPAPNEKEVFVPFRVKPVPLTETLETDTLVPPVLVMVPERDWFEPTVMLPKLSEVGFELS